MIIKTENNQEVKSQELNKLSQAQADKIISQISKIKEMGLSQYDNTTIKAFLDDDIEYHLLTEHFDLKVREGLK